MTSAIKGSMIQEYTYMAGLDISYVMGWVISLVWIPFFSQHWQHPLMSHGSQYEQEMKRIQGV